MARAVLLGCLLGMVLAFGAEAQSVPQYKDYPAKPFKGARAAVDVSPPDAWNYRSVLRKGAKEPINFAGRYVFTSWGVGRGCETGAAIDVSTGRVTFFPYNACFWREKDPPFIVETGSRLFISTGNLGEDGPRGAHFFEFTGREFRYLMTNPYKEDVPRTEQELAFERGTQGMIFQDEDPIAESARDRWNKRWVELGQKPFDLMMLCYSSTADVIKEQLYYKLSDKFETHFVLAGGNSENAELAIKLCDQEIQSFDLFNDPDAIERARHMFRTLAAVQDLNMLKNCTSDECKVVSAAVFDEGN